MSDPDLYSTDPWRREAARAQLDAKRRAKNQRKAAQPRSTNNNSLGNNKPKNKSDLFSQPTSKPNKLLTDEDIKALDEASEFILKGVGLAILGAMYIPFKSIKSVLDWRDGISFSSKNNNVKAGILTAGFFAVTAGGITGIDMLTTAYNEHMAQKYPEIGIAMDDNKHFYIVEGNRVDAFQECRNSNPSRPSNFCNMTNDIGAGTPQCIAYSFLETSSGYLYDESRDVENAGDPTPNMCRRYYNDNVTSQKRRECRERTQYVCNF